jgi:MoaA/NifB/PqqE/SkfB family radical SAM enzyme
VKLAASLGCDGITFSPMKPRAHGETKLYPDARQQREINHLLTRLRRQAEQLKLAHNLSQVVARYRVGPPVWEQALCYIGWTDLRIGSGGKVSFCGPCGSQLGNAFLEPLSQIWNGGAARRFRQLCRSQEGLRQLSRDYRCEYCCHLPGNQRGQRYLGWLPAAHVRWLKEQRA